MGKRKKHPPALAHAKPAFDMSEPNEGLAEWGDLSRVRRGKLTPHGITETAGVFRLAGPDYRPIIDPVIFEQMCDEDSQLQKSLQACLAKDCSGQRKQQLLAAIMAVFESAYLVRAFQEFEDDRQLVMEYLLAKADCRRREQGIQQKSTGATGSKPGSDGEQPPAIADSAPTE